MALSNLKLDTVIIKKAAIWLLFLCHFLSTFSALKYEGSNLIVIAWFGSLN